MAEGATERILQATVARLLEDGHTRATLESLADAAGCAKGLVNYHFQSKRRLIAAAETEIRKRREARWAEALTQPEPRQAIRSSWEAVLADADDGTAAYARHELTDWSVDENVERVVAAGVERVLRQTGRSPRIDPVELGALAAITLMGLAAAAAAGGDRTALEGAHSAFWVGLLALTDPA